MSYHIEEGRIGNSKFYDKNEIEQFTLEIESDRWVDELPPASKGMLPQMMVLQSGAFDRQCLYVTTIDQYNPSTIMPGEYSVVWLMYSKTTSHLRIFDSNLLIVK